MYADLRRYYGVDASGLVAEPPLLSPVEVLALIENLPQESATSARMRDEPSATGWDTTAHLVAIVADAVRENTHANLQVRTKKKIKPPERLPVPGVKKKKPKNTFVAMAQAQYRKAGRL